MSPDNIWVATKAALPQTVSENYNCVLIRTIFIGRKGLAPERRDSQNFE